MAKENQLSQEQIDILLGLLESRFINNMKRHSDQNWLEVKERLMSKPTRMWSLQEMERTGGEPDVVGHDEASGGIIFYDCAAESPVGRRSVCYDREGLESRKEHKPKNSAMDMAKAMGIELLSETQYRDLQKFGSYDLKTSSWLLTPPEIRKHGGAIFGDHRYGQVFIYHNGAQSYFAARGFRGSLIV